jgi:hypothetical protein
LKHDATTKVTVIHNYHCTSPYYSPANVTAAEAGVVVAADGCTGAVPYEAEGAFVTLLMMTGREGAAAAGGIGDRDVIGGLLTGLAAAAAGGPG